MTAAGGMAKRDFKEEELWGGSGGCFDDARGEWLSKRTGKSLSPSLHGALWHSPGPTRQGLQPC